MSIELKLQAILETKAALQAALNLPNSVPFSQYAGRINWKDETPPADLLFADYTKDRYSVGGVPVGFSDVNEFTRLTAATNFVGGELVEYAANKPRIEAGKGFLIEPEATNILTHSMWETGILLSGATAGAGSGTVFFGKDIPSAAFRITSAIGVSSYYGQKLTFSAVFNRDIKLPGVDLSPEINIEVRGYTEPPRKRKFGDMWQISSTGELVSTARVRTISRPSSADTDLSVDILATHFNLSIGSVTSSYISVSSAPVTRAPDLLRLTIPAGKTLTLDADAGVSFVMENATTALITATEPGYIRSARVN